MSPHALLGPVFAMMALTFVVWTTLFIRRVPVIRGSGIDPDAITPEKLAEISPPSATNASDNFKNLFEMPVLFYALAGILIATERVDAVAVGAAWIFVLFRVLHSAVHCTINRVTLRFGLYLVSSLALWFLVLYAALGAGS